MRASMCPAMAIAWKSTVRSRRIRACASLALPFNNALLEVYSRAYATMGAHSDQALDLDDADESTAALVDQLLKRGTA